MLSEASASGMPAETVNQMKLLRLEAVASVGQKGQMSEAQKREAVTLAQGLSQLGAAWSKRVYDIAVSHLKDPRILLGGTISAEWIAAENLASEDKFEQAIPAYQAVLH